MTVLYPKPCYNEACCKGTALFRSTPTDVSQVIQIHVFLHIPVGIYNRAAFGPLVKCNLNSILLAGS